MDESDGYKPPSIKHTRSVFTTYTHSAGHGHDSDNDSNTILEAARATIATTYPIFQSKLHRRDSFDSEVTCVDNGLGIKRVDLIQSLIEEAYRVFPKEYVACIVSLGTGQL